MAVSVYLLYYAIRPFENELALSDMILQISGSRGSIILGASAQEIISFAFKLMPDLILECYLGIALYRNYCTASVFIFSRLPDRKKWYIKETRLLLFFILFYETILHTLMLLFSVFFFDVRFNTKGFFLLGYNILLRTLWIFLMALLRNICGILFGGSNFGLGIIMAQLVMIALLSLCNVYPIASHFNPIAMLVLGWHHSMLAPETNITSLVKLSEGNINMLTMGRSFEETGLSILLASIAAEFLGDINISMQSGKIYGFWGPNGSGKTMFFRALSGLIRIDSGTISLDDKELHRDFSVLPDLGIMIENTGLYPELTGFENLCFLASLRNIVKEEEVRQSILRVGLDPYDKRTYRKYSLGMKQRLSFAQAIMESPQILMLDEVTNALDEDGIEMVRSILQEEKEKGVLILLTSHRREDLKILADKIYQVKNGSIDIISKADF